MTETYDCEHCEHWVKDSNGDRVCEFDGDCENFLMTNEEYLHSLNTEQLAEFLDGIGRDGGDSLKRCNKSLIIYKHNFWVEWLKQPHGGDVWQEE